MRHFTLFRLMLTPSLYCMPLIYIQLAVLKSEERMRESVLETKALARGIVSTMAEKLYG